MTGALEWFRTEICERQGHTHGPEGEMDCLLAEWAKVRASKGKSP